MSASEPRISIGLPVRNGERYLHSAVDSILAQTFADFELIISDNASTDGTETISRDYAGMDERIRYYRNATDLGAARNFRVTFEYARGGYFKWAAADDVLDANYLSRCVQVLDRDRDVVLCHSQIRIIDESGHAVADYRYPADHAMAASPSRRFRDVLAEDRWCFELFGLVRSDYLRSTRLLDRYVGSDRILLAELALRGRYCIIPEFLFLNRDHPDRSIRALPYHHLRGQWFDPSLTGKRLFPHWRILTEYARCISRSPIGRQERATCYVSLGRWLAQHHNWARLGADLIIALVPASAALLHRTTGSKERWLSARVERSDNPAAIPRS